MKENPLTPDEIIATLKHSSLSTVLIEGRDDLDVFRKIEQRVGIMGINFLPCGGKNAILAVYERKKELKKKVMFFADKDLWLFTAIPKKYSGIFYTKGYCIENDLYEDGCELLLNLLDKSEVTKFDEIIQTLSNWFAFEIENMKPSENLFCDITILSTNIMDKNSTALKNTFLQERDYKEPKQELKDDIYVNYKIKLRGKFIFQAYEKIFQNRSKKSIKYDRKQLFDLCFTEAIRENQKETNINNLINEINSFFQDPIKEAKGSLKGLTSSKKYMQNKKAEKDLEL